MSLAHITEELIKRKEDSMNKALTGEVRISCSHGGNDSDCNCAGFVGVGKLGTKELCRKCKHEASYHDEIEGR